MSTQLSIILHVFILGFIFLAIIWAMVKMHLTLVTPKTPSDSRFPKGPFHVWEILSLFPNLDLQLDRIYLHFYAPQRGVI